jgi:ABC-2 type transport system permease protein
MNPLASDPTLPEIPKSASSRLHLPAPDLAVAVGEGGDRVHDGLALPPVKLSRRVPLSSLLALLDITVARQLRGRRLLIFSVLFSLPILFAVLARRFQDPYDPTESETLLIFGLVPQALLPLTSLLFASGMVQDDIEEQTLTYLLVRPIPRWLIYIVKLTATWLVNSILASVFTVGALVAVYWGTETLSPERLAWRAGVISGILSLSLLDYIAIFGLLSLVVRRSLVLGIAYTVIFEGVLANIDFVIRHATVMYYLRTLSVRLLDLLGADWSIDLSSAPSTATCVLTMLATSLALALLGGWIFSVREFRVKTPEGS